MAGAKATPLSGEPTSFASKDADMGQFEDISNDSDLVANGDAPLPHAEVNVSKVVDPMTVAHINGNLDASGVE